MERHLQKVGFFLFFQLFLIFNVFCQLLPPSDIVASSTSATQINLSWTASAEATSYDIERSFTGADPWTLIQGNVVETSFEDNELTSGVEYFYRVKARNSTFESDYSSIASATTRLEPVATTAPTNVTANSFEAQWTNVDAATGYKIDVSTTNDFSSFVTGYQALVVDNSPFLISDLNSNQVYYYRVVVMNAGGDSEYSNVTNVTTLPGAPSATAATSATNSSFTANWNGVENINSYRLDVAQDENFANILENYNNLTVTGTSQEVSGLSSATAYYYRVRAFGDRGPSENSNTISVTTDELPPAVPVATAATNISQTAFTANWSEVSGAISYRIDVSTNQNLNNPLDGYNDLLVSGTSREITGLTAGETYYYQVRAVGEGGTSGNSNIVSVTTDELLPPAAPIATAATNISQTAFTANWSEVSGATSYRLDVSTNQNLNNPIDGYDDLAVSGTSREIAGLAAGETYYYQVRAVGEGGTSGNSNIVSVTTDELPPPAAPNATAATNISQTAFTANWSEVSGATSYRLDVSTNQNLNNPLPGYDDLVVSGTSRSVSGLTAGETYYYQVRAVGEGGTSGNSNIVSVTTDELPPPAAPNATAATNMSQTAFTANWSEVSGATSYRLDVSTNQNLSDPLAGYNDLAVSGSSRSVNGLTAGETYYYRVRAVGEGGTSGNSNIVSVTTDELPPPAAPNATTATNVSQTAFTANWSEVSGATSYRLDVSTNQNLNNPLAGYDDLVVSSTSREITGLTAGETYYYRVRAVGEGGTSGNSNIVSVTTDELPPPAAPNATAATNISQTAFTANWSEVSVATSYRIDVSTNQNLNNPLDGYNDLLVSGTSREITGLTAGETYYYQVRAVGEGGTSGNSNIVSVTTDELPPPAAPNATAATNISQTAFTANWSEVSGATSYRLDVSTNQNLSDPLAGYDDLVVSGTSRSVSGLTAGETYYYQVRAVGEGGTSGNSNIVSVTTDELPPPAAPNATAATNISQTAFTANWSEVSGATSYRLDVSTSQNLNNPLAGYDDLVVSGTSREITGLTAGETYYYRVRAVGEGGTSGNSNTQNATTLEVTPPTASAPSDITTNSFVANWTDVPNADNYQVDVSTNSNFSSFVQGYNSLEVFGNSVQVSGLSSSTTYYYRIRTTISGELSDYSNVANAITYSVSAPNASAATSVTSNSFVANWSAVAGAIGYLLDVSTSTTFASFVSGYNALAVQGTSQTVTGLASNTNYRYRVRTVGSSETSTNSNVVSVNTDSPLPPASPVVNAATNITSSGFTANWQPVLLALSYEVEVSEDAGFTDLVDGYDPAVTTLVTFLNVTGLEKNKDYWYRVRARDLLSLSENSEVVAAKTQDEIPASPTGLTATAVSSSQINLQWTDNADNETSYLVQSSTSEEGEFSTLVEVDADQTTYSHTGLSQNTTRFYRIIAHNEIGDSPPSNVASAQTQQDVPAAPTSLTATASSSSEINLAWTDNADNETNYVVQSATAEAGPFADLATLDAGTTSYPHTGLSQNTRVYYRVIARNGDVDSDPSNTATAVTNFATPAAPTNLAATAASNSQINLAWTDNADNETNYVVQSATAEAGPFADLATLDAGTTSYPHTGLSQNTRVYYRVIARNGDVDSDPSNTASAVTNFATPAAPTNLAATAASSSQINLTWTDNADNETNYIIQSATAEAGPFADLATLDAGTTSYPHTGLLQNTRVYYRVIARNGDVDSDPSNTATAVTNFATPAAPTNLTATAASSSQINLTWTDNADNETNYIIQSATAEAGPFADLATLDAGTTSYPHAGLSQNTRVYYRVIARNGDVDSDPSNTATAVTNFATPAAPTNLTATAASNSQINLTWTDNADNETNYIIQSATAEADPFADLATLDAGTTSYPHVGLSQNTRVYYRVIARNETVVSAPSNVASAVTNGNVPVVPANFSAIASGNQINLSWTNNTDETGYVLERRISSVAEYSVLANLAQDVTTYPDLNLPEGTTYYYRLKAVNLSGESAYTEERIATTLISVPTKPLGISATAVSISQIDIIWNDNLNEVTYVLEQSNALNGPYTVLATQVKDDTTFSHINLAEGATVFYRVKAVNPAGESLYSDVINAATFVNIPSKPTGVVATAISGSEITVSWTDNSNESSYVLESSSALDGVYAVLATPAKDAVSSTHTGLAEGTTVFYRLSALNSAGTSEYSDTVSATTTVTPPAAPTVLSATAIGESEFTANWTASVNAVGYRIDVSSDNFVTFVPGFGGLEVSGTSQLVNGLTPNTTYKFRVRAINAGGESPNSTELAITTISLPPVANPATVFTNNQFVASWAAIPNVLEYRVDVSTSSDFASFVSNYQNAAVAGTSLTVTGLSPATNYYFRVRAVNAGGASLNSNVVAVITLPNAPAAPVATVATDVTQTSFMTHWNPVPGATSYELDVSTNSFVTTLPAYTSKVVTNTFETIAGLSANTQYQYRVRAVNTGGKSPNSNYISTKTLNYPPNAPVAATPASISKSGFTARWSRVSNVSGYRFDLSVDNFVTFITGYLDRIIEAKDTSLVIAGLSPETNYQYRVRAINDGGPSPNSNQISVTTLPNVPGQPHALPATNVAQTSFTANWEVVAGSSGYKLDISTNGFVTFVSGYNAKPITGTSEAVMGLSPNVAYQYRIRAVNPGGESVNSNVIDVKTLPNIPATPVAYEPSMLSQTGFTAHWSIVPGATAYQFDVSNDNFRTFIPGYSSIQVNDTSLVVTNLVANSSYQYRVRAINPGGVSGNSNVISVNTLPFPPEAPVALDAAVIRKIGFTANWTAVPGATTYYLDVSEDNFQTVLEDYDNRPITDTSFIVTGLLVNTNYQYRVRAGNIGGISPNSNTISVSTLPNITGSPIVTNSETNEDTQTPPDLTVKRALPEDPDITHFKIFNIQNGALFMNDGLFQIEEGGFITVDEGLAGLRFTPALNVTLSGSYEVQASTSASDAGLVGEVATATISIIPINDPPILSNMETEILQFSQGDNTTLITETLNLIDVDDELLDSAVVQFQSGYQQGHDFLYFPNTTKIKVKQYDAATGTLLLTGQATALEYEDAFRTVLFYNDIIGFTDVGLKVVSFKIWDGKAYSEVKTRKIQITDVFVELEIPNGITPNQDGVNDTWTIENIELYPDCFVEIYGRNGERLFQSSGYKEKWNGTYNGNPLQVGTYYYFIDLREKGKKYKGAIAILR